MLMKELSSSAGPMERWEVPANCRPWMGRYVLAMSIICCLCQRLLTVPPTTVNDMYIYKPISL